MSPYRSLCCSLLYMKCLFLINLIKIKNAFFETFIKLSPIFLYVVSLAFFFDNVISMHNIHTHTGSVKKASSFNNYIKKTLKAVTFPSKVKF